MSNIERIRKNTVMRRRKLFCEGGKRKKPIIKYSGPDADYGLAEQLDGLISDNDLKKKTNIYLKQLDEVNRKDLEYITREQSLSNDWHNERKKRLTTSNFGEICKMRKNTSCRKKVYNLLYRPNTTCKQTTYGIQMEPLARAHFENHYNVHVQICGLFCDKEFSYLGATPGNCFI